MSEKPETLSESSQLEPFDSGRELEEDFLNKYLLFYHSEDASEWPMDKTMMTKSRARGSSPFIRPNSFWEWPSVPPRCLEMNCLSDNNIPHLRLAHCEISRNQLR